MPGSQLHLNKSLSSPSPVTPTLREHADAIAHLFWRRRLDA
nr:hypothetical protein [Hassalia byssoidea]